MKPLPTKAKISFDVPKLLSLIKGSGHFDANASLADMMVIRSYVHRHPAWGTLVQTAIRSNGRIIGYRLTLRSTDVQG